MTSSKITESTAEEAALNWLSELGYSVLNGPSIAPDELLAERTGYGDVILSGRLQSALTRINPGIPSEAIEDAYAKIIRAAQESPSLHINNQRFHRMLTDGVDVSYQAEGREKHDKVWLLDVDNPDNNDWLAVNQFTVIENRKNRRPDIVVFVNGLPLAVVELKNPADEQATIRHAYNQLQTYKGDIPSLFAYNELLVISDGLEARVGPLVFRHMENFPSD